MLPPGGRNWQSIVLQLNCRVKKKMTQVETLFGQICALSSFVYIFLENREILNFFFFQIFVACIVHQSYLFGRSDKYHKTFRSRNLHIGVIS